MKKIETIKMLQQQVDDQRNGENRKIKVTSFPSGNEFHHRDTFRAYFDEIPHQIWLPLINCEKANDYFLEKYLDEIWNFQSHTTIREKEGLIDRTIYYFIFEDALVNFDFFGNHCRLLYRDTDTVLIHRIASEIH